MLEAHVAADGRFAIGGVPPGTYDVVVIAYVSSTEGRHTLECGPLRTIELPAAANAPLQLDLAAHVPAHATLRVFVDGQPWSGTVGLARIVDYGLAAVPFAAVAGVGHSPALPPGTYVPFASVRDDRGDTHRILGAERFVLAPGANVELTASLTHRVVRVRVDDANGQPVPNLRLALQAIDCPECTSLADLHVRTDARGEHVFDPAPPGRLRVRAFLLPELPAGDQDLERQPVLGEIAADATSATFDADRKGIGEAGVRRQ